MSRFLLPQEDRYILTYWSIRGRGARIRPLMAIGGPDFLNNNYFKFLDFLFDFLKNFIAHPLPLPGPEKTEPVPFDDGPLGIKKNATPWVSLPKLTALGGRTFG